MVRWAGKVTLALFMIALLGGCWDTKDIDHRQMPIAMGIAKEGDDYVITLQLQELIDNRVHNKIIKGSGYTITNAIDKLSMNMESRIDLLHVKVVVIEKPLAEEGINDIISGFMRARDVSPNALVVVCEENLNQFFSKLIKNMDGESINFLEFFEKHAGWTPHIALTRVWHVYRTIYSYTQDVGLPIIVSGDTTIIEHLGSAIIKNGKMVGQITSDETLLFNAFNGETTQAKIEVLEEASVLIVDERLRHKSELVNHIPHLRSVLELKVVILETRGEVSIEQIKSDINKLLTDRFNQMFSKAQQNEADILALGQLFRNNIHREDLKNWRSEYYPKLKVEFEVETEIQNTGFLKSISE